jgi:hypothetical protein
MSTNLEQSMQSTIRQVKVLRVTSVIQFIILLFLAMSLLTRHAVRAGSSSDVLRIRGLIIEDHEGRARILVGAPFPSATGRKRQDDTSSAILFLDAAGSDRLLVGEGIGAQINGKIYSQQQRSVRGSSYGINIMDGSGNERGGFGFTAMPSGGGRAIVALDRPVGDAWGAVVDDKTGWVGMTFNYPMPLGEYQPGIEMGLEKERPFLHLKDKNDYSRSELSLGADGTPSLTVQDKNGKQVRDLFGLSHQ